jgi:tetratricopeptide (TPR) repeat protein
MTRTATWTLGVLLSGAVWSVSLPARADVAPGDPIQNVELPMLGGGKHALLSSQAQANVFVFFRPRQDHSLEALKAMAACEKEFSGRPVHFVAVVSSSWPASDVEAAVVESGTLMPVLIDQGDVLYGRLGVRLHPAVGVANEKFQLVAYEPFRKLNYCERVRGKIRYALHEIGSAEVAQIDDPARAAFPNEMKGAVATRYVRMGELYFKTRQYEKAAAEARHGVESDPRHAPALVLLGDSMAAQGKCPEAAAAYDAAGKLDSKVAVAVRSKRDGCALRK